MTAPHAPQVVRRKIEEAQTALIDLGNLLAKKLRPEQYPDLDQINGAASKVSDALDAALWELQSAVCEAESALDRL
jgi:hypothetical protein